MLRAGTKLGAHEIVASLGAGGMGEVYRARDTKLDRDVALKVLPESFTADPDRLIRFEREAKALAALNHPNIAQVYGVEDSTPTRAIIMELVEGPTLEERLHGARGLQSPGMIPGSEDPGLHLHEALAIARQIADALEYAHERGIIHRDLKPANIKVGADDAVKVLDFGLAKAIQAPGLEGPGPRAEGLANSPTMTSPAMTAMGVILGTAAYMAPEQARGKAVDRRADIWAFGCVLYEMLTGRTAFGGETTTDVLAAVVTKDPDLTALPAATPPAIQRLLRHCLEKEPRKRLGAIGDARFDLDEAEAAPGTAVAPLAARPSGRLLAISVASTAVVVALVTGAVVWRVRRPSALPIQRLAIVPTPDVPITVETNHADVAITSDGSRVVYFSQVGDQSGFVLRSLDRFDPIVLKDLGNNPRGLAVSPDGEWIAYETGEPGGSDAALYKAPIAGGTPIRLCDAPGNLRGVTWLTPSTIVFATASRQSGLLQVPAAGGIPEVLTTPRAADNEIDHLWPQALPDGKHVLFAIVRPNGGSDIGLFSVETKTWRVLIRNGLSPRYSPTGHIVFGWAGTLKAVPFDVGRLEVTGEPVQVLAGVTTKESGAVDFALAGNGTLVYLPGQAGDVTTPVAWRDADGHDTPLALPPGDFYSLTISPDGRYAAAVSGETSGTNNSQLWLIDLSREVGSRLTPPQFDVSGDAVWSPDSRRIAFWSATGASIKDPGGIFIVSTAGTTAPQRLTTAPAGETQGPGSWSKDGRLLFTRTTDGGIDEDIMQVSVATGETTSVLAGPSLDVGPALSPDGHWLAYTQVDQGLRLFIRSFPNVNEVKIPVTSGPGLSPAWSDDGRTLYYQTGHEQWFSVPVTPAGRSVSMGPPVEVTAFHQDLGNDLVSVAVPPVDHRFLVAVRPVQARAAEYRVVLNWFQELKARMAARNP
jgi:eukaryotic-like serine/threonine-protein kinase